MPSLLPSDFDRNVFLQKYWQQQPLLIKSDGQFVDPITPEELAGLACEDHIESRIVRHSVESTWGLQRGPFAESEFLALGESNWSLLVQAVDQWWPPVAKIKSAFDFIPSWRIDDVMVSFAAQGGGVGPHFDRYDVFLIQGQGSRLWKIGAVCSEDTVMQAESELRILDSFQQTDEFILNTGDILYLPPRYAHWGTSLDDSLCYSLGFRGPSYGEIIQGFGDALGESLSDDLRFVDGNPVVPTRASEISAATAGALFKQIKSVFDNRELFTSWLGNYLTEVKYPELMQSVSPPVSSKAIKRALSQGVPISKNPMSRFAFHQAPELLLLFVDGRSYRLPVTVINFVSDLCDQSRVDPSILGIAMQNPQLSELIRDLVNQGSLFLAES